MKAAVSLLLCELTSRSLAPPHILLFSVKEDFRVDTTTCQLHSHHLIIDHILDKFKKISEPKKDTLVSRRQHVPPFSRTKPRIKSSFAVVCWIQRSIAD